MQRKELNRKEALKESFENIIILKETQRTRWKTQQIINQRVKQC